MAGRLRLKYGRDGRGGDQDAMGNRRTRSHERSRETQGIDGGVRGEVQAGRRRSYSIQEGSFKAGEGGGGRCYEGVEESLPTTVLFAISRGGISASPENEEVRVKKLISGGDLGRGGVAKFNVGIWPRNSGAVDPVRDGRRR